MPTHSILFERPLIHFVTSYDLFIRISFGGGKMVMWLRNDLCGTWVQFIFNEIKHFYSSLIVSKTWMKWNAPQHSLHKAGVYSDRCAVWIQAQLQKNRGSIFIPHQNVYRCDQLKCFLLQMWLSAYLCYTCFIDEWLGGGWGVLGAFTSSSGPSIHFATMNKAECSGWQSLPDSWMIICEGAHKEMAAKWLSPWRIKASFSSDVMPVAPSLIPGMLALGIALSTSSCHKRPENEQTWIKEICQHVSFSSHEWHWHCHAPTHWAPQDAFKKKNLFIFLSL